MIGVKKGYARHSVLGAVQYSDNLTEEEIKRGQIKYQQENKGFMWQRFYDVKDYVRVCPSCRAPISRCPHCSSPLTCGALPPKRPADFWALNSGRFYLLEAKSTTSKAGFLDSLIRGHQKEALTQNICCGGKSYLLIGRRAENTLYPIPFQTYECLRQGRAFVKWEWLDAGVEPLQRLPDRGSPYFNMNRVFRNGTV